MTTEAPTYADQVSKLAEAIQRKADQIRVMEKSRRSWTTPQGGSVHMGDHIYLVDAAGVRPQVAAIHREILVYIDGRIASLTSELEGLRFKLVKLGRSA